jgi:hypothetical protein
MLRVLLSNVGHVAFSNTEQQKPTAVYACIFLSNQGHVTRQPYVIFFHLRQL